MPEYVLGRCGVIESESSFTPSVMPAVKRYGFPGVEIKQSSNNKGIYNMAKSPMCFRAVPSDRGILVEHSRDGANWEGSMDGLDEDALLAVFTRLRAQGAVIVEVRDKTA